MTTPAVGHTLIAAPRDAGEHSDQRLFDEGETNGHVTGSIISDPDGRVVVGRSTLLAPFYADLAARCRIWALGVPRRAGFRIPRRRS
jgi:hypothetical protein